MIFKLSKRKKILMIQNQKKAFNKLLLHHNQPLSPSKLLKKKNLLQLLLQFLQQKLHLLPLLKLKHLLLHLQLLPLNFSKKKHQNVQMRKNAFQYQMQMKKQHAQTSWQSHLFHMKLPNVSRRHNAGTYSKLMIIL